MNELSKISEIEREQSDIDRYKNIKPESNITPDEAIHILEDFYNEELSEEDNTSLHPTEKSFETIDPKEQGDVLPGSDIELSEENDNGQLDQKPSDIEKKGETDYNAPIVNEVADPIKNKLDGLEREKEVAKELEKKYPPEKGYQIVSEAYLRDKDGNIVKDPETGEARRIDFVVVKDGKVVDSIEVTSKTADKTEQCAKEDRIRDSGGNYIRDNNGNLVQMDSNVRTRIERRD